MALHELQKTLDFILKTVMSLLRVLRMAMKLFYLPFKDTFGEKERKDFLKSKGKETQMSISFKYMGLNYITQRQNN